MKKIFILILVICIGFGSCLVLTACNAIGPQEEIKNKQDKNIDLNIIVDGSVSTFMVTEGQVANVTSFTKPGYYLMGIYDQNEGGTRYFDSSGESTTVWQKTYPTTLYAQWGKIGELSKMLGAKFQEEAYEYTWAVNLIWAIPSDFLNAVNGNLTKDITITLSFRLKEGSSTIFDTNNNISLITLKSTTGDDAETFGTKTVQSYTGNYTEYQLEWCVPARCVKGGRVIIEFNRGNTFNETFILDAVASVAFEAINE